ncbi:hypothetical protein [Occallatibacter savannae]|uniref:hypothetical protein n=1 Tax=Occallatibacter savannae TaxID=1002691 RepID=UPI0013A58E77|nr:hypothetical protein [Occallatibacter savannae]
MHNDMTPEGWKLVSAEGRNAEYPSTFLIPSRDEREALVPGDGAKLLFDIQTSENGIVMERMWVIVKSRTEEDYIGVLDSDPVSIREFGPHTGESITFRPEHIASISSPPREYVIDKYGVSFFGE